MVAKAASLVRGSRPVLMRHVGALEPLFLVALRSRAPALAARSRPGLMGALLAVLDGDPSDGALAEVEALLAADPFGPRAASAIGFALLAALTSLDDPQIDDAVRSAWVEAYVEMVERRMATRWNRMDLVA